ncbi:hypothetical protein M408DRAFT_328070 [Serendipita vermifera MAFF 305830]|uniref:Hyaluronan-mediated motility receptor C-terminal domain-containing protein n=1 Tax=Serendipita vermifera MAFF 305830 TaxID=933852 RepID=A0A0C2WWI0_SERVB|nr:hypothetical protein M408DRAFT_328070 [Serendipita vermifera MAFF 305830]
MFGKAPRFVPQKPSEVPGPGHYTIPEQEGWDAYKQGPLEIVKAERLPKDKPYEGPDAIPSTSDPTRTTKDASRPGKKPEAAPNVVLLRQQIEALQTHNAKLERMYETETKRHQEQAASDKQRIEALVKQTSQLETQLAVAQKTQLESKRELERMADREKTTKLKLERLEAGNRDSGDRSTKTAAMRKELDELQKLHEEGKKAHRAEVQQLKSEFEKHQKTSTDQVAALKKQAEAADVKAQESKKLLLVAQSEINEMQMYGKLAADSVPKSKLEEERLVRYELQMHSIKLERRSLDKDVQMQELVAYLRTSKDQYKLLQSSLADAEAEIAFLRDMTTADEDRSLALVTEAQSLLQDELTERMTGLQSDLAYAKVMQDYHAEWSQVLLEEYKSAGHCAASLEAALTAVLERTAELDGQLQVANVESGTALKRAKEADAQVLALQREIESVKERKEQQILDLATEKDTLAEEGLDLRRKSEDAHRRIQKLETTVREKAAAEKALSDDVEGLTDALQDALRYEHAYKSLCQEVDALVSRNQLVEREAEHLSRFNAEILGHTNPGQKIHYLDRIRRDLADTKQKLALSTKQRDTVLEDNDNLRTELHAYRSLSESQRRGTGITRVNRLPLSMSTMNSSSPENVDTLPKVLEDQTLVIPRSRNSPMTLEDLM